MPFYVPPMSLLMDMYVGNSEKNSAQSVSGRRATA